MGTPSPLVAADGLFATKGMALPLDKMRPEGTAPGLPADQPDGETAILPGIFAEETGETTADLTATWTEPGEPPPAASLLTIATQGSAARSPRRGHPALEPETIAEATAPADQPDLETTDPNDTAPETPVYLPVLMKTGLPSIIAAPDAAKPPWHRKAALLAASIAVLTVATIALYPAETPTQPQSALTKALQPTESGTVPPEIQTPDIPAVAVATPTPGIAEIQSVRFEDTGRVVVKGSAPPKTELIVLRNRRPLGAVRSGPDGAWTFSAIVPQRTERHEISVAPLRIDASVVVDRPPFIPRPRRRPALPSPGSGAPSYFVQIASLPTAADAGREALKLTSRLSGTIAATRISVRATTIGPDRTVYRVAIGGYTTKESAVSACGLIRTLETPCLVMQEP